MGVGGVAVGVTAGAGLHEIVVDEINKIKGDLPNLPKNLMSIFKKYATQSALGSNFTACDDIHSLEQYDLGFVSVVLMLTFPKLGHGSYSGVFSLGDRWVLKVNCQSSFWSPRDGGFTWLMECTKYQSNPYIPKLLAIEQSSHLYFAVVERLETGVGLDITDGSLGDLACESYAPEFDVKGYMGDSEFAFAGFIRHNPHQAIEVARFFESYRERVGGVSDFETSNNILHRNGFPVLNDPICDVVDGCSMLDDGMSFSWMLES